MLSPLRSPRSNEEVFVALYSRLLAWARQIAGGDRDVAEDLVHDAFFNATASRRTLATIDNLDGYLFTMLRNLHIANVRRRARRHDTQMPLVEYESAAAAIHAVAPTRVHDELAAICHYACLRRLSSKTGSVLLLRFFHGYQAVEIAAVLRISTDAVDNLLRLGRRETRLWLQDPQRLRFLQRVEPQRPRAIVFVDPANVLRDLQDAIFGETHGECAPEHDIRASYQPRRLAPFGQDEPLAEPLACLPLAHLVTCRRCLDLANETLGLPRLADRHLDDGLGQGPRPPRDPGAGTRSADGDPTMVRRRARSPLRRQPAELRITANGHVIGSQQVSAAHMSQEVLVQSAERLGFVEVLDEQDERLFLMSVEAPPDGAVEQIGEALLPDGCELTVSVSFAGTWPSISLTCAMADESFDATPAPETLSQTSPRASSTWAALRNRLIASMRSEPRVLRPALIVFAVLLLVVALAGPSQAWSTVARIGRSVVEWVADRFTDRATRGSDRRDLEPARRQPQDIDLPAPFVPSARPRPRLSPGLSEAATLELEVEILQRLDAVDALYGEGLSLTRPGTGRLRLDGTVRDAERRRELMRALGALVNIPQLDVRLRSAAEAARTAEAKPTAVRTVEVTRDRTPISELFAQRALERGVAPDPGAEDASRALAGGVVAASRRALRHAWAFATIARQVPDERLHELHADAYAAWRALLARHAAGVVEESFGIERQLSAVGLLTETSVEPAPLAVTRAATSTVESEHLVSLVERQEQSIRALFVVAPDTGVVATPDALRTLVSQLRASQAFARGQIGR